MFMLYVFLLPGNKTGIDSLVSYFRDLPRVHDRTTVAITLKHRGMLFVVF